MYRRQLGCSDLEITPVSLGTWALGGWLWGGTGRNRPDETVHTALDAGINLIDTAPVYGFGRSEEEVGKAIIGRRDEVYLATKCGMVWDDRPGGQEFFETEDAHGRTLRIRRNLTAESIRRECEDSLRRLKVETIDLYQCHWPDRSTPLEETIQALEELREEGKIRWYGVSNFNAEELLSADHLGQPVSQQVKFSPLSREIENDVLPCCRQLGLGVLAYSPMEMGLLTGKIGIDHEFPHNDTRRNRPWFQPAKRRQVLEALDSLRRPAADAGLQLGQLAIAWTHSQPGITTAIAGARNAEQARSNAAAAEPLQEELQDLVRHAFAGIDLDENSDPATVRR